MDLPTLHMIEKTPRLNRQKRTNFCLKFTCRVLRRGYTRSITALEKRENTHEIGKSADGGGLIGHDCCESVALALRANDRIPKIREWATIRRCPNDEIGPC